MLHTLIPILAATAAPALLILAITYALRPQGGRHTGTLVPDWLGPYDLRTREAIAHYADKDRHPGLTRAVR